MTEIPILPVPFFRETVTLTGADYILDFQYNQREDRWYLSVSDAAGVPIYGGRKIVPSVSLLRQCADARQPPGLLVPQTLTTDDSPPGLNDLGSRIALYYYEPGEL